MSMENGSSGTTVQGNGALLGMESGTDDVRTVSKKINGDKGDGMAQNGGSAPPSDQLSGIRPWRARFSDQFLALCFKQILVYGGYSMID
jgi:hypothetical protein